MVTNSDKHGQGWGIINWTVIADPPDWLAAAIYAIAGISAALLFSFVIVPTLVKVALLVSFGNPTSEDLRAALLGVGAIVAAPFVIWRIWTSHVSALATQKQAMIAFENLANTTFSNAVEQLGSVRQQETKKNGRSIPNLEARLSAIFTLTELARTQQRFRFPVIEMLAAYVRENNITGEAVLGNPKNQTHEFSENEGSTGHELSNKKGRLSSDILSAIYSLSVLSEYVTVEQLVDLSGINLRNSEIRRFWLSRTVIDRAQLEGAFFWDIRFSETTFQEVQARDVRLFGGKLIRCFLKNSNFEHAGIDGISFLESRLINTKISNASVSGTKFFGSYIAGCDFSQSYCYGANFFGSTLNSVNFVNTGLQGVKFKLAELDRVVFSEFPAIGVYQTQVNAPDINLELAWLENTNLSPLKSLTQAQIDMVFFGDDSVILPTHLTRPKHWPIGILDSERKNPFRGKWVSIRRKELDMIGVKNPLDDWEM